MKLDALEHPKTCHLAALLDVTRPTVIGHLELLWAFTGKHAAQGNIGKWPDGAIARACDWMGSPEAFTKALVESGFAERSSEHRLTVHDWSDHAPGWVRAKLKKLGLSFIASSERSREPSSDASLDDDEDESDQSLEPSILGKRSEVKRSEAKSCTSATPPARKTDPEWWDEFKQAYPNRAGDQGWRGAQRAAHARTSEGHTPQQFIEGARRYAAYCVAKGDIGTQYVKRAEAFLGPENHFLEPWTPPPSKAQVKQDKNISASLQWLAEEEAKDAARR